MATKIRGRRRCSKASPGQLMLLAATHRRPFGTTGLSVSPVAFGSAPVGLLASERESAGRLMNRLLDEGVNVVDTAAAYMGAEETIGATLGGRRDEFILVSKCGADSTEKGWVQATRKEELSAQIDRSLRRLNTDVIDVMLIHSLPLDVIREGWPFEALQEARSAGKIRFAGYSGDNAAALWAVQQPGISVLQTSLSLVDQVNTEQVLPAAAKHGVAVLTKRSIANGCWRPRDQHYERYHNYVDPYRKRFAAMGLDLARVAPDVSGWSELAIRFTLSFPHVHTAIVGGTSIDRALENLANASRGPLPHHVVDAIRSSFAKARAGGGEWSALT
ncbi:MAG: aldo/keto reductase [Phycisphaerae bacterium]|jgi:aryl-alcohol dehydrogenase-like predicted oxidoreductase|nr:aldo/keto reductase [Phycisphaerae bacterium]